MPILHKEASWNPSNLDKAQTFVEMQGMAVGCYDGIELKDTETKFCTDFQGIFHQLFTDMQSSLVRSNCIAGIADMSAAPDIVGVQDI